MVLPPYITDSGNFLLTVDERKALNDFGKVWRHGLGMTSLCFWEKSGPPGDDDNLPDIVNYSQPDPLVYNYQKTDALLLIEHSKGSHKHLKQFHSLCLTARAKDSREDLELEVDYLLTEPFKVILHGNPDEIERVWLGEFFKWSLDVTQKRPELPQWD